MADTGTRLDQFKASAGSKAERRLRATLFMATSRSACAAHGTAADVVITLEHGGHAGGSIIRTPGYAEVPHRTGARRRPFHLSLA